MDGANQVSRSQTAPLIYAEANVRWTPPPLGTFKCNVDGACDKEKAVSGVGWVVRDAAGQVRWYVAKAYPLLRASLEAEATTLVWAMSCLDNLGFSNLVFESDSKQLTEALHNPLAWPRLIVLLND